MIDPKYLYEGDLQIEPDGYWQSKELFLEHITEEA